MTVFCLRECQDAQALTRRSSRQATRRGASRKKDGDDGESELEFEDADGDDAADTPPRKHLRLRTKKNRSNDEGSEDSDWQPPEDKNPRKRKQNEEGRGRNQVKKGRIQEEVSTPKKRHHKTPRDVHRVSKLRLPESDQEEEEEDQEEEEEDEKEEGARNRCEGCTKKDAVTKRIILLSVLVLSACLLRCCPVMLRSRLPC